MLPAARLPIHDMDHAAALAAIGCGVHPRAYLNASTNNQSLTWFCDHRHEHAQQLLAALKAADPKRRLVATAPESPFLACLAALRVARAVAAWVQYGAGALPQIERIGTGRLCGVAELGAVGEGLIAALADRAAPCGVPADPAAVAALIVCGFIPQPVLKTEPLRVVLPAQSDTFPGLLLPDVIPVIQKAMRDPATVETAVVGDYAPGEHPLCYALAALICERQFRSFLPSVRKDPVVMQRGRERRSALVSLTVLDGDARARELTARHLAGL